MGIFRPRRLNAVQQFASVPPPQIDLNAAIETILVKGMNSQMELLSRINNLMVENVQLVASMQTRVARRTGGRIRSRTGTRGTDGQMKANCRLCKDPMLTDPTATEIVEHATHRPPTYLSPPKRRAPKPARPEISETEIIRAPDGAEITECQDCQ